MATAPTALHDLTDGYAGDDEDRPLAAYAALSATFGLTLAAALAALHASGRELPERPRAGDLVLAAGATHKVSRLLASDVLQLAYKAAEDRA